MLLAFLLTFGTTLYAQSVCAHDAFAESGSQRAATMEEQAGGSSGSADSSQSDELEPDEPNVPPEPEPSGPSEPVDPEPVDPEPVDPEPVDPEPVDPEPVDPEPSGPSEPVDPQPADPEPSGPSESADPEPSGPSEPEVPAADELRIADVGVFLTGTNKDAYAFASSSDQTVNSVRAVIDQRGGEIDFDAAILWNDGSDWEYDSNKVDWELDSGGETLATLSQTGVLTARGTDDGTVRVIASVDGSYTEDGAPLKAMFLVELRGQTDTKYVTDIVICDDSGAPFDSYRFEPGTLATATLDLTARVTVFDPATNAENEYLCTPSSGLASQTNGEVANLFWESSDTRLGAVSEEGIYRPVVAGTNKVIAYSTAGFNGSRVEARATIDMPTEDGEDVTDYNPQNELTVKVYYETVPDQYVAEKTYTVDDLEALGTFVATYTAVGTGTGGCLTTTGRGPLLSRVLQDAGVNTDGVARLHFDTPDNYQGSVSWSMLVDTDRYYFPNYLNGGASRYDGMVQVAPMIAIDSYRNSSRDTSPHYDELNGDRRFLLLFGSKTTGESISNLQVYNMRTIYVVLEGAPPVEQGTQVNVRFVDSITNAVLAETRTADPDSVSAPAAPEHEGYTFKGWSKSVDDKGNVTYTTVYDSTDDKTPEGPTDGKSSGASQNPGNSDGSKSPGSQNPEKSGEPQDPEKSGEPQDPEKSSDSQKPHNQGNTPTNDGDDESDDGGTTASIVGNDDSNNGGMGTYDLVNKGTSATAGPEAAKTATGDSGETVAGSEGASQNASASNQDVSVTKLNSNDLTKLNSGRFSVLQAINRHPSDVATLMMENPFAPYALPSAAGVMVAGGLEVFIRFRRQKRFPVEFA